MQLWKTFGGQSRDSHSDSVLGAAMVMIMVLWFCGRTSLLGGAEIFKSVASRCQRFAFNYSAKRKYV